MHTVFGDIKVAFRLVVKLSFRIYAFASNPPSRQRDHALRGEVACLSPRQLLAVLCTGQDIDEWLDIKKVNDTIAINIRFGLKRLVGQKVNEW